MSRGSRAAAGSMSLAAALVLLTLAASFGRTPYPEAPPPAHTGGFGEPTCHACHLDYDIQPAGEALEIHGLPSSGYTPGESYRLTVELTRADIRNAGFQLAIRFADAQDRGAQAGALGGDDERTETTVLGTPPVQYIHHTRAGITLTSPDTATWSFIWTAPESDLPVSIDISANAGNDDGSELGDYIYARSYRLTAR